VSQKQDTDIFSCNISKHCTTVIFSWQKHYLESRQAKDALVSPRITSASALPGKSGNMDIAKFTPLNQPQVIADKNTTQTLQHSEEHSILLEIPHNDKFTRCQIIIY